MAHSPLKEAVSKILWANETTALTQIQAVAGGVAVTDKKKSADIMHSIASQVSSSSSLHSELMKSGAATFSQITAGLSSTLHGMTTNHALDPFTFAAGTIASRTIANTYTYVPKKSAAVTTLPPPPATPVATLLPAQRRPEVPAGVPEYNFRMCQFDMMQMGLHNKSLVFDIPKGSNSRWSSIDMLT